MTSAAWRALLALGSAIPSTPDVVGRPRHGRAAAFALLTTALAGCVSLPPPPAGLAAASPAFTAESFFAGVTQGEGVLTVLAHRPRVVRVHGTGELQPDGTLVLSQTVEQAGKPAQRRHWRIRQVAPNHYEGTLSDAAGPVAGDLQGNVLLLRFRMTGGLRAEQRLYLHADGRTVTNRMTVRKLGVPVGVLNETIRKIN